MSQKKKDPYSQGNIDSIHANVDIKLQLLHYNNSDWNPVMTNTYIDYHEVNHKYANHEL